MQYSLLFSRGEYGWYPKILQNSSTKKVTARQYYTYKLQICNESSSLILLGGRLLQQYIVDNYVKIETLRLNYLRSNQNKICRDLYQGLHDSFHTGITDARDVGQRVILPSSFLGGPCDMYQRYQDAMSLVHIFGKPDFFVMMTCNLNWPEIQNELLTGQKSQDRPDLTGILLLDKL